MKVTIIGQFNPFAENIGGIEVFVDNLYDQLRKKNIETKLVGWSNVKRKEKNFIPLCYCKRMRGFKFSAHLLFKGAFLPIPEDSIIHVQRPDHIIPFIFKKNKIVCTLHGAHIKNVRLKKGPIISTFLHLIQEVVFRRVDKVICVSSKDQEFFTQEYPVLKDKIDVIPVGIDTAKFKPLDKAKAREVFGFKTKDKIALFIGRLEKEKQVDLIIKSFRNIDFAKLIIVGKGREEEALRRLASNQKNVIFISGVPHTKIPIILNCADVLVLASKHEGMPTVILEALACGVPVISTDVGDVRKVVINNKTGFLADHETIRNKMIELLKKGGKFKKNCVGVAKNYSWERIGKQIIEVYGKIK